MRVDKERLDAILAELDLINQAELAEIEFYVGGDRVVIDPKVIAEWKDIGLNTTTFFGENFYRGLSQ